MLICSECRRRINPNSNVITILVREHMDLVRVHYHAKCAPTRRARDILKELSEAERTDNDIMLRRLGRR